MSDEQTMVAVRDEDPRGSNCSGNPHIVEMVAARISRRSFLSGGVAAAAVTFLAGGLAPATAQSEGREKELFGFAEVPPSTDDTLVVPPGYTCEIVAPWGAALRAGAPAFREDASNTAADQALQVGFNHDGLHFFPLARFANSRGLLVVNHEYTDA